MPFNPWRVRIPKLYYQGWSRASLWDGGGDSLPSAGRISLSVANSSQQYLLGYHFVVKKKKNSPWGKAKRGGRDAVRTKLFCLKIFLRVAQELKARRPQTRKNQKVGGEEQSNKVAGRVLLEGRAAEKFQVARRAEGLFLTRTHNIRDMCSFWGNWCIHPSHTQLLRLWGDRYSPTLPRSGGTASTGGTMQWGQQESGERISEQEARGGWEES